MKVIENKLNDVKSVGVKLKFENMYAIAYFAQRELFSLTMKSDFPVSNPIFTTFPSSFKCRCYMTIVLNLITANAKFYCSFRRKCRID